MRSAVECVSRRALGIPAAVWLGVCGSSSSPAARAQDVPFRPPAIPLVTHDPYFSVWSFSDRLTDDWSRHWTGAIHAMCGMVRIDGKPYRFMGTQPADVPAMEQTRVEVGPLCTTYTFEADDASLTLTFLSPMFGGLEQASLSATHIDAEVRTKGKSEVSFYLDVTAEWVVNTPSQLVEASRFKAEGVGDLLRLGSSDQPILKTSGDNRRIDWGYLYLVPGLEADTLIAGHETARHAFAKDGRLPYGDDLRFPRAASDDWPVLSLAGDSSGTDVHRFAVDLAYDDLYAIEYFRRQLRPYWNRDERGPIALIEAARRERMKHVPIDMEVREFEQNLLADLERIGGAKYARLAALAYRQTMAAHKIAADFDGTPLMFSKENFSNGCIGTVDVIYPASPFFLVFSREMLKAQLRPVLEYARSARWPHRFAPHDLGTYPLANGQVYGGGEKSLENQMPVEESGNMLIMMAAIAYFDGDTAFAKEYWPLLTQWADYLLLQGMDPLNQLCTDDFTGHLAHNANLSLKAIVAIGAFAQLCEQAGLPEESKRYRAAAEEMVSKWLQMADDGDHYRLAFDRPGTWSQKYNLVWDRILGLELFPPEVARKEIAFYKTKLNRYGLPLDNRATYTKLDWAVWTAALTERREDFELFVNPLYDFAHETPQRVPLTDWFDTTDARQVGFQARSVVGGIYLPMLMDEEVRKKWTARK